MSHRLSSGARVNQWGGSQGKKRYGRKQDGSIDKNIRPSYYYKKKYHPATLSNPGNLIVCGSLGGGRMGNRLAHETEAPFCEKLAEFMIRSFCPPGGVVLDPFLGSGTTVAVAKKLGRKYIGIDIRKSQIELTRRRLAE